MAREKRIIARLGGCVVLEDVTERFTHKVELADGTVLRGDPEAHFWMVPGMSYYGVTPEAWNESLAVEEAFVRRYEVEADYS